MDKCHTVDYYKFIWDLLIIFKYNILQIIPPIGRNTTKNSISSGAYTLCESSAKFNCTETLAETDIHTKRCPCNSMCLLLH